MTLYKKGIGMKQLVVIVTIFCLFTICFGQQGQFSYLNTSRYARVVSLANAFTGLADDIETVYYNSAGIALLEYYAFSYSKGQGSAFVINDYNADDMALILPTFKKIGIFALSIDRLLLFDNDYSQNLYRIHYGRNVFEKLAIGASFNYYHLS